MAVLNSLYNHRMHPHNNNITTSIQTLDPSVIDMEANHALHELKLEHFDLSMDDYYFFDTKSSDNSKSANSRYSKE